MEIKVGDRITYKDKKGQEYKRILEHEGTIINYKGAFRDKEFELVKIERPTWEVVEENKELLTEEEREFLKQYLQFSKKNLKSIKLHNDWNFNKVVVFWTNENGSGLGYNFIAKDSDFNNLELEKVYTLKELGLEE